LLVGQEHGRTIPLADISTAAVHHLKSAIADASAIHRALLI
jgi:hypothetical protein